MVDVTHGLLLVWGEERLSLLHGALSIFPAWLGFDTVLRFCYSLVRLFDSQATGNRFYSGNGTSHMVFKENSHHQQSYNITYSIPGSRDIPESSLFKSWDPGIAKKFRDYQPQSGRRPVNSKCHHGYPVSSFGIPLEISSFPRRLWYSAQILSVTRSQLQSSFRRPGLVWGNRTQVHFSCVVSRSATMGYVIFRILRHF